LGLTLLGWDIGHFWIFEHSKDGYEGRFLARKILSWDMDEDVDWIYISLKKEDRSGMKRGLPP
jgi:hypothetical protein